MFARRLAELKARELELKLRSLELRGELREQLQDYKAHAIESLQWVGLAGGTLGLMGLLLRLRHGARARQVLVWLMLGLRLRRLWRRFSAKTASSSDPVSPHP